jgi:hypothetical protein
MPSDDNLRGLYQLVGGRVIGYNSPDET